MPAHLSDLEAFLGAANGAAGAWRVGRFATGIIKARTMIQKTYGCDVSKYQGEIDFALLQREKDFVVIRSSYGTGLTDPMFARNRDQVRATGMTRGYYHYGYPTYNAPEAEAESFFSVVGELQPGEFIALDFEEAYADPVSWCLAFLIRAESLFGTKPLVYLNENTILSHDWTPVSSAGYGLWIARYGTNSGIEENVSLGTGSWPFAAMWQYTSRGSAAGHAPLDLDVFFGSIEQLQKYGWQPPVHPQDIVYDIPVAVVPLDPLPDSVPVIQPPTEPTIMKPSTIVAAEKASAHFLLGASLYAAVAGLGFIAQHFTGIHLGTAYDATIGIVAGEAIQALLKFFSAKKEAFDAAA